MQKIILVVAALLLVTSANVIVRAQSTSKNEDAKQLQTVTVDAWRQALPLSEETGSPPILALGEARDTVEARETAAQIEVRILDLQQKLMDALKQRDSAMLKQLLADDFMPAGANLTEAQSDKARFIEWSLKSPELKSYAAEKTKVRVFPSSTAVVTTYYKQRTAVGGVPTEADFTATDVWVKRKKLWQAVSHHVSQLSPPPPENIVARPKQAKQTP